MKLINLTMIQHSKVMIYKRNNVTDLKMILQDQRTQYFCLALKINNGHCVICCFIVKTPLFYQSTNSSDYHLFQRLPQSKLGQRDD